MAKRSKRRAATRNPRDTAKPRRRRPHSVAADDEDRQGLARTADDDGIATELAADDDLTTDDTIGIDELAERLAIGTEPDEEVSEDYGIDSIVGAFEAGLGGGLDQAEEARLGITDEELARRRRR